MSVPIMMKVDGESALAFKLTAFPVTWVGSCNRCGKDPTYLVFFQNGTWKALCWDCVLASKKPTPVVPDEKSKV